MRNVVGAAVYSPIYTNGVGTIYFDAVNGWTGQATEDETNPYQIVVEIATETADGTPFTEENCAAERDDGTIDPFGNIDPTAWTPVRQYPVRVSATGEMATPEGVLTNRLAVTTGKSMTEFYRVYVPVNLEACCFRIRRVTRYDLAGNDGRLILLDNILVSYPPMSAELEPTGLDTTTDPEKKGAFTFGQELATTVPFPAAGETNVFGRAAPIYHVNGAVADVDPASFIQAAKMHYRWRYLNQRETPWATLDLDVMNGFRTVTPLEIPDAVGDMEFWFDSLLQAPFFRYVDYSGSGKGLPSTVYTEEIATAENRLNAREPLPSGGRDWFFRLRNGTSAWEGFAIELAGGTALDGRYPMELLDDETWRALVRIPTNATGLCSFTFVGSNETTPGATELPGSRPRFYPGAVSVTNSIPANGTLAASGAAQSFEIDHNANYLEVKVSTKFNTWSVSRAEYQNFNNWHDAYTPAAANPAFKASYPTNGVDDVTMTTRVVDASGWKLFSNADPEWNEPFYSVESDSPAFPKDEVFSAHTTPNVWNAYNFSFVSCNFTTKADHNKPTTGGGSGIAAKLLGQGQGSLEFTKANAPNGVDTVTVQARLGQSMTFDAVSYDSLSLKKKNYTFVVPAIMSEKTPENGNSDGDMTVGASVSLFGYYRPSRGAYEFRVERRYKANTVNLSLYKWAYVGGAMTPTLLCEQDFGSLVMWWDKGQSNAQFQPIFIRFEEATDGTKIIAGLGAFRAAPNGTGSDMNTAFTNTKGYGGLVFTDRSSDRLTAGSYGVAAKDCPAQFVLPFHYDEGTWDGLTINENGNTQKGSGRYFNPSGNALTLPAGFSPDRYSIKEDWEIIPGRCEYYTYKGQSNWAGLRIPETLSQTLDLYLQLKGDKSGTWRKSGSVPIKGSAFATYTFPVHMAGQWNLRLKTGSSNVDVAIKSVTQTQWQAPDHEDWSWQDDDFVYSQGLVQTNKTLKLNTVTLQPSRGTWTRPLSVRSPLLNGLGKVSFSYTGVEEHAEIWVQMATNNVGNTLTGYNGYNESLASVDLGVQEPAATWVTIAKYTAADLAKASSQTVYLGYHNQPDDPIEGAFRLFIPTNVVYAAGVIATNDTIEAADKNLKYGQITITGMTVTDEPGLSDRSWFGFNLRGIGDGSDEEKRMYLTDMTLVGESGSGLDLALNNSLAGIAEGDRERARATYPSIVSPTFKSSGEQKNGVGTVAFKARLYSTNGLPETEQGGIVEIFGSQNSATGKWEPITNFVVRSSVFQDFKWESRGKIYAAVKFQVTSAAVKDSSAAPDRDRVILDEIVVGERIQPALSFLYARPFRNNLMTPVVIDDILSINEQPLVGESWGVQTQLSLKQLTDEIDLDRGFEVSFVYHTGEEPWGYEQWGKELKSIPLVQVGAKDDLIFRSVGESPESLYEPQTTSSTIVQYQVLVKYFDRQGTMYTSQLESKADWQQPDWYHPVDFNAKHGGYASTEKFSAYTILDTVSPGRAWINEVNFNDGTADQNGGDVPTGNQFMEICVPSGVDMSGWFVRLTDLNTNYCVLARFGDGEALPKSKATVHEVEGFEFVLMESPETNMAGGIRDAEGNPVVADGIWSRDGIGGTADLGTLSFARPFQFELVRPSGIVEHQFVLGGTNTFANKSYGYMYDATNLVAKLEANGHSPIRFLAGDELARLSDNARLASAGVMGGTADGNPAPGAKETWQSNLVFTPGRLNRDETGAEQVIPEGWYVAPNGTNVWVTLKVEGDNLVQNLGGETNSVVKFVVPQGATTNVTYTAKPWYELAELDANGERAATHVARFGHPYVFEFAPTGRTYTVVAKSGFDSGLDGYIDLAGPYAPSIVSWLNERWPGRTADEIKLGKVKELGASSAENPLELLDMYWLDIPPFATTPEEEAAETIWWLRFGIANPMYGKVVRTRQYGSASDPVAVAFTNIQLEAKMYISNDVTKVAYAPYRLQGLDNAKSDESAGRWTSESFQLKGVLNNGQPLNEGYLPFRSFKFAPGSFTGATDANPFTSRIEIIDPFSTESPGYGYGWNNWPNTTGFFFKLALTTNSVPHTVETLKADSTYDSGF